MAPFDEGLPYVFAGDTNVFACFVLLFDQRKNPLIIIWIVPWRLFLL